MRIYTRHGDSGDTDLFGGERRPKHAQRIAAYGEVDELNAVLGWCAACETVDASLHDRLHREQSHLFVLGSWLATAPEAGESARRHLPAWPSDAIAVLEGEIDGWAAEAPELKSFILPGGSEAAARLHVARTVCRRAERAVAELANAEHVEPVQLAYVNRLSDWLFQAARAANHAAGVDDVPWIP